MIGHSWDYDNRPCEVKQYSTSPVNQEYFGIGDMRSTDSSEPEMISPFAVLYTCAAQDTGELDSLVLCGLFVENLYIHRQYPLAMVMLTVVLV